MYPAAFEYHAPDTLADAVAKLADLGADAKIIAGGCSLIPLMKLRLAEPEHLIDLRSVAGLRGITLEGDRLVLGAMTREAEVESSPLVAQHAPLLAETSTHVADPQVRNMGTIGGNAAHADPANDHPATLVALDATFRLHGPSGAREVAASDFFVDIFTTALGEAEVLTAITVPVQAPVSGSAYVKIERQVGDFAVVAAAVRLEADAQRITSAAIVLTNVGPVPVRAGAAEELLIGRPASEDAFTSAGDAATDGLEPWSEQRGSSAFKLRLVPVVVRRALVLAAQRMERARVDA